MEKRDFSAEYKTKVVLEVLEGEMLANEIAAREKLNPKVLSNWKQEFLKNAHRAFTTSKEERHSSKELKMAQDREQELMAKVSTDYDKISQKDVGMEMLNRLSGYPEKKYARYAYPPAFSRSVAASIASNQAWSYPQHLPAPDLCQLHILTTGAAFDCLLF